MLRSAVSKLIVPIEVQVECNECIFSCKLRNAYYKLMQL